MNDQTDQQLLRDYGTHRSEAAFAELVRRHVDLVHSAAHRMVGDTHLARDITQATFVALAQHAAQLTDRPALTGWLHTTARNLAGKTIRTDARRRVREQEAVVMNELLSADSEASWEEIAPHLDAVLGELTEPERDAVLLRYFEKKSAAEIGRTLGISAAAAQKRVSRAVERLRECFAKRGVTVGAGGLVVVISANAVQAAPVGLALTISTAAALAGTAVTTSTLIAAATKTIAMTTLQKTLVAATVAVLAGAGIYEARQAAQLRNQVQRLEQQQAPLTEQIQQLRAERDNATNRLAGLIAENSRLKSNPNQMELLRLRGEVTRLRNEAAQANDPVVKKALEWKANVEKMKLLFAENPEQQVPEMKLLSEDYFFDLARDQDLKTSGGVRKAYSEIRNAAKNQFAIQLQEALKSFIEGNDGKLPGSPLDLKPYFQKPVEDAMLDQYALLFTGKLSDVKGNYVLRDKAVIDQELDGFWQVGPYAYGSMATTIGSLMPAIESFTQSNGGVAPTSVSQLKPFITTPELQSAYEKAVKEGVILPQAK